MNITCDIILESVVSDRIKKEIVSNHNSLTDDDKAATLSNPLKKIKNKYHTLNKVNRFRRKMSTGRL